jgi:hypothetical protein
MPEYHVFWEIDVTAENEKDAAKIALEMQRDPDSFATVFKVGKKGKSLTKYQEVDAYKLYE